MTYHIDFLAHLTYCDLTFGRMVLVAILSATRRKPSREAERRQDVVQCRTRSPQIQLTIFQ